MSFAALYTQRFAVYTRYTRVFLKVIAICFAGGNVAFANNLAAPVGEIILTVSGDFTPTNTDKTVQLDLAGLQAMGITEVVTSTIWTEGKDTFHGLSLHHLLETLGITGTTLKATAINDYSVEIPTSDAVAGGPILAYKINGQEMSVRDKGPVWLIYPYDSSPDYRTEVVYVRSIWQLTHIEVLP